MEKNPTIDRDTIMPRIMLYIAGNIAGALQGTFGSIVMPTSIRRWATQIPGDIDNVIDASVQPSKERRLLEGLYQAGKVPTKIGGYILAGSAIVNDIASGGLERVIQGDFSGAAALLIPISGSIIYEEFRRHYQDSVKSRLQSQSQ